MNCSICYLHNAVAYHTHLPRHQLRQQCIPLLDKGTTCLGVVSDRIRSNIPSSEIVVMSRKALERVCKCELSEGTLRVVAILRHLRGLMCLLIIAVALRALLKKLYDKLAGRS